MYIPQHGQGTASLNVTVATSIVLHHFAIWAGYQESSRHGFKFDVAAPPQRTAPRGQTVQKITSYNLSCLCCSNQGSCLRACRKEVLMLQVFNAMFRQALIQSSTLHALLTKKYKCGGSFTCTYKHLCAGQVPLTDAEAQALKKSRQTSASQDWLMGAEPIEHETTACQDSGKSLLTVCNTILSQAGSVLPESHLMAASPDMLCCVSQLYAFS